MNKVGSASVVVLVVGIRKMRMLVYQRLVPVRMAMAGAGHRSIVLMLVMFVMHVLMIVRHLRVSMPMFVTLGQMEPSTQRHQESGNE